MREAARKHTAKAIARLVELMDSAKGEVAARACEALLDRAWGRPPQAITGDAENPLQLLVEQSAGGLLARLQRLAEGVEATPSAVDPLLLQQAANESASNGGTCEPGVRDGVRIEAPARLKGSPEGGAEDAA